MKIWEAIQMLKQMDQTRECTINFSEAKETAPYFSFQKHPHVNAQGQWLEQYIPGSNKVTCDTTK